MTSALRPSLLTRVLSVYLVAWEPAAFALVASAALSRLLAYGLPAMGLLVARALVTGLGIAAGRALWRGDVSGFTLGRAWALLHAALTAVTFATPYFPSNRVPGTKGPILAAVIAVDLLCWLWLSHERRSRAQGAQTHHA